MAVSKSVFLLLFFILALNVPLILGSAAPSKAYADDWKLSNSPFKEANAQIAIKKYNVLNIAHLVLREVLREERTSLRSKFRYVLTATDDKGKLGKYEAIFFHPVFEPVWVLLSFKEI